MPRSKGEAEIKKSDMVGEGEREFRRKSFTKELFNLSLHSICARVQCSWNMCVYRTTVPHRVIFVCAVASAGFQSSIGIVIGSFQRRGAATRRCERIP